MTRSEVLHNLLAQLIYSPDNFTANSIKNHLGIPRGLSDKPEFVQLLVTGLEDTSDWDVCKGGV